MPPLSIIFPIGIGHIFARLAFDHVTVNMFLYCFFLAAQGFL